MLLAAQVADAWATAGAHARTRACLREVTAARETVVESDEVGGLLSCGPAREANYLSWVYQCLGAADQAVAIADQALVLSRAQPVRSYATEAQVRLNLVRVFLQLGDLEAATEAIRPVLRLPPERRLHTLIRRIDQLDQALADTRYIGDDAAQSLRHRIAEFVDEPLATTT